MERIIALYMDDCHSRQLRPKTMQSYEQALKLFATWLEETLQINQVEQVKDMHIRSYINDLQKRGKYTFCADRQAEACRAHCSVGKWERSGHIMIRWWRNASSSITKM